MDNVLILFPTPKEIETADKVPHFVDTFYNLVTDIYEWGWGQSFHFSTSIQGKSHRDLLGVEGRRPNPGRRLRRGGSDAFHCCPSWTPVSPLSSISPCSSSPSPSPSTVPADERMFQSTADCKYIHMFKSMIL
ncbi:unnamed protein product [Cuscuta campestris]|uniref:Uncharacterized protein n=1 Tax=Cuscuta campestris TaxID=132261 RepID=A0A484LWF7_9ASTE|nr:unnamed protein product [Cuscuta campestris]